MERENDHLGEFIDGPMVTIGLIDVPQFLLKLSGKDEFIPNP